MKYSSLLWGSPTLISPDIGYALSGAKVEGLIHTARELTEKPIELSSPAVGGFVWPGGVSCVVIDNLHFRKSRFDSSNRSSLAALLELLPPAIATVKNSGAAKLNANQIDYSPNQMIVDSRPGEIFLCARMVAPLRS